MKNTNLHAGNHTTYILAFK